MNIALDLRAIYGHFAGTPFIQPRLPTSDVRAALSIISSIDIIIII